MSAPRIKIVLMSLMFSLYFSGNVFAEDGSTNTTADLVVKEIKFSLGVENRNPKDAAVAFYFSATGTFTIQ